MQERSGLPPGTRFGGDFTILRTLGAGASATVYEAREDAIGRVVALKTLDRAGPDMRARFLSEARAMAAVRHPAVAEMFRFGEDAATGLPFLAMERFEGSLADRITDSRVLPEAEAASIGLAVAGALAALHGRTPPLVHRDVKPSNILFSADGRVALADFGLVRRLAPDATALTAPGAGQPGTWLYAAPEQRAGAAASPAMDWYAFGVTLFRCLTGGFPGPGGALPVDIAREVGRGWQPLLRGLLQEEPQKRLCDPDAIMRALRRIRRRAEARGKRRRAAFAASAAAFLVAVGVSAWALRDRTPAERPEADAPAAEPELRETPAAPSVAEAAAPQTPAAPAVAEAAAPDAGAEAGDELSFSAVGWARQYAAQLRETLSKAVENPAPDAENRIVVRAGEILLSGDIAPSADPPTVVLDGGALHFSHGAAVLRSCIERCDRFVSEASGTETVPPDVMLSRRETFRNPIAVTENGGYLDHGDDAFATLVGPIGLAPGSASGVLDVFGLTEIEIDRRALVDSRLSITGCGKIVDVQPNGRVRNRRWFEPDNPFNWSWVERR